jgi:hypothetical protein
MGFTCIFLVLLKKKYKYNNESAMTSLPRTPPGLFFALRNFERVDTVKNKLVFTTKRHAYHEPANVPLPANVAQLMADITTSAKRAQVVIVLSDYDPNDENRFILALELHNGGMLTIDEKKTYFNPNLVRRGSVPSAAMYTGLFAFFSFVFEQFPKTQFSHLIWPSSLAKQPWVRVVLFTAGIAYAAPIHVKESKDDRPDILLVSSLPVQPESPFLHGIIIFWTEFAVSKHKSLFSPQSQVQDEAMDPIVLYLRTRFALERLRKAKGIKEGFASFEWADRRKRDVESEGGEDMFQYEVFELYAAYKSCFGAMVRSFGSRRQKDLLMTFNRSMPRAEEKEQFTWETKTLREEELRVLTPVLSAYFNVSANFDTKYKFLFISSQIWRLRHWVSLLGDISPPPS